MVTWAPRKEENGPDHEKLLSLDINLRSGRDAAGATDWCVRTKNFGSISFNAAQYISGSVSILDQFYDIMGRHRLRNKTMKAPPKTPNPPSGSYPPVRASGSLKKEHIFM